MKRATLLVLALFVSIGCGRINTMMKSWVGHHYSELLMSWGPPQAVYDDGRGGRILVYTQERQWTTPGRAVTTTTGSATVYDNWIWGQAQSVTYFQPGGTSGYTAYRMFQINSSGYIYNWSWRGL